MNFTRSANRLLSVVLVLGTASIQADETIPLSRTPIDPQQIAGRDHPLITPRSASLKPLGDADRESLDKAVPADACVAEILLGGKRVRVVVWGEASAYHYSVVRDHDPSAKLHGTAPWDRYLTLNQDADDGNLRISIQAGGGTPPKWVRYFLPEMREGTWRLGGRGFRVALVDTSQSGDYLSPHTRFLIDLDGDGQFQLSGPTLESLSASGSYQLGSFVFRLESAPFGDQLKFVEASQPAIQLQNLAVGTPAPDFQAQDFAGKQVKLSDLRGKFVFLDIWATWCGPCVAEIPNLQRVWEKYCAEPLTVVGVSIDDQLESAKQYVKSKELTYDQFWCEGGIGSVICKQYQVTGIPATFLIAPDGTLLANNLRGEALEETISHISAYDTAEGKSYFESLIAFSRLTSQVALLQGQQRNLEAMQLVDQFIEAHPQSPHLTKVKRTRRWLQAEAD